MSKPILRNQLKVYRAKYRLTQQQLAERIGVTRKTINVIEAGNYSPSITLVLAIAEALQSTADELFWLEDV
jgi:putative transcriptional regulator